jgi:uncharacterized protein (TIGR03118 family)
MNCQRFFSRRFLAVIATAGVIALAPLSRAYAHGYLQTNLVSDKNGAAVAPRNDVNLVNPWGMANIAGGPFWISDNATGFSSLYDGTGTPNAQLPKVTIPTATITGNSASGSPDGIVWNGNPLQFADPVTGPAQGNICIFIFATEDGTISCWAPGNFTSLTLLQNAQRIIDNTNANTTTSPVYKGLAIGTNDRDTFIYATDFRNRKVVSWNSAFGFDATLTAAFQDSTIPATFAPFGIQNINGDLWVTYAKQDAVKHDPIHGAGLGFVDVFNTNGRLLRRFATRGVLDAPWAVVHAPQHFGQFSEDILIGNFGDGKITAWDPQTAGFIDWMRDPTGKTIVNKSLWALSFGGSTQGANSGVLYFTAGLVNEGDGLFGTLIRH